MKRLYGSVERFDEEVRTTLPKKVNELLGSDVFLLSPFLFCVVTSTGSLYCLDGAWSSPDFGVRVVNYFEVFFAIADQMLATAMMTSVMKCCCSSSAPSLSAQCVLAFFFALQGSFSFVIYDTVLNSMAVDPTVPFARVLLLGFLPYCVFAVLYAWDRRSGLAARIGYQPLALADSRGL